MSPLSRRSLLIIAVIFSLAQAHVNSHPEPTCGHDHEADFEPEFLDIDEDLSAFSEDRHLQTGTYPNIRIVINFDAVIATAPASYADYIQNQVAPAVVSYLQGALRVIAPVVGNLKISSTTICGRTTPSILRTTGVPADYYTFFDTKSDNTSVVASSSACYLASSTKRPLIAQTIFNRPMFKEANGDVLLHEKNMYLLFHEMFHTFGFSDNSYKYFIDATGKTRTGHIKTILIDGENRTVLDVPPLTDRLRAYYGCPTLEGAIMENDGGSGTDGSHFERKFFVYEHMSSGGIYGRRVSQFSLALLEGSGWYVPDYSYAEPFFFGQGQGCNFVYGTCSATVSQFDEFCIGSSRGCAPHGRSGGFCSGDSIADGCRYVNPYTDYDCENPDAIDNARNPELQVYGRAEGSKCFMGNISKSKSSTFTSWCFKYNCTGSGLTTKVQVSVGTKSFNCTAEGPMNINMTGYYGQFNCPDPITFCSTVGLKYCPRNCLGIGTCVNNQCQCPPGYSGIDCGLTASF